MHWSTETIFRVLEEHEADHPLARGGLSAGEADLSRRGEAKISRSSPAFRLAIARTASGLAFFFPDLCQQNQRSHDAGRSDRAVERIYRELYARVRQIATANDNQTIATIR